MRTSFFMYISVFPCTKSAQRLPQLSTPAPAPPGTGTAIVSGIRVPVSAPSIPTDLYRASVSAAERQRAAFGARSPRHSVPMLFRTNLSTLSPVVDGDDDAIWGKDGRKRKKKREEKNRNNCSVSAKDRQQSRNSIGKVTAPSVQYPQ